MRLLVSMLLRLFAAGVVAVLSLALGFAAFSGWLVSCTGYGEWYEGACDRSSNPLLWLGFIATLVVIVSIAGLVLREIFRLPADAVDEDESEFDISDVI